MMHFLIVYARRAGRILEQQDYSDDQAEAAQADRSAREQKFREDSDIEVVLLNAESREALEKTHSRYFRSSGGLLVDQLKESFGLEHVWKPRRSH